MRALILLPLCALAAGCPTSKLGACSSDGDCPTSTQCDAQQHVCAVPAGVCFPACSASQQCESGTATCVAVQQPDVSIAAPAAGSFAEGAITAVAVAHAPGGVHGVLFELRSGTGTLLGSAQGTASSSNPASFSGAVPLSGVVDGAGTLQAVLQYGSDQKLTSAPVSVIIDQTAPAIAMQTDGRTSLLAGGQTATVRAQISDGTGSGVQAASVALKLPNHADVPGAASGNVYTFSVTIDDSVLAAGSSGQVAFDVVARDLAGHLTTLASDPKAVLNVDRDAPQIANVNVTSIGFTQPDGGKVFDTVGTPLKVQATITDGAGVSGSSVCLRVAGETGACPHLGAAGTSNTYTFDLPRPSGSFDGQTIDYTISADDALAAPLSGSSKAEHQRTSPAQHAAFDNTPPVVAVASDTAPYARVLPDGGAPLIDVTATITDGTGVASAQLLSGAKTVPPSSTNGNVFVFQLDPRDANAGVEGSYAFQVTALDHLGHTAVPGAGTRVIDGAAPLASVKIFLADGGVPSAAGVTYPAAVANTGWTGATFVYSDRVLVEGTLSDLSGIAAATLHVDGIELDGGVSRGATRPLGCAPGSKSCPFSVALNLNNVGSAFHTGAAMFDAGSTVGAIPAGPLQFTIEAQDTATAFGGTAAANAGTSATPARTTRLLWQTSLPGTAVSGLAVHPDGDLIVTLDGGTGDTVFSLAPDQPVTHWSFGTVASGATNPIDGVIGTPAIGTGDGTTARVYIASDFGNFYAINPDGSEAWETTTPSTLFNVGPAVTTATISSSTVEEIIVPDSSLARLRRATSATDVSSVATSNPDPIAAPLILNGNVYFATQSTTGPATTRLTTHVINPDGSLGAALSATTNPGVPWFGPITNGVTIYAATRGTSSGMLAAVTPITLTTVTGFNTSLTSSLVAEPTIGIDSQLYGSDLGNNLGTFDPVTGARTQFAALGGVGLVPLQGSDGRVYVPRKTGLLLAFEGNQVSWEFDPPTAILRYAMMDCSGRLFVASGNTVYAFVTDDSGLADTPWPSLRRDARNTGNASTGWPKYGMRTSTGCTQ